MHSQDNIQENNDIYIWNLLLSIERDEKETMNSLIDHHQLLPHSNFRHNPTIAALDPSVSPMKYNPPVQSPCHHPV
jgi:hypothetical protein